MERASHPFVTLATQAVRYHLAHGLPLPCPEKLSEELKKKGGVFVSIKKNAELRGCIGNLTPTQLNLAAEIIYSATSAATRDPRFNPVTEDELDDLTFSVDVLTPLKKVLDKSELDCKVYGLAVHYGEKHGVLLPDLEGIGSVDDQIRICLKKGGIKETDPYEMFRFQVERYH